MKWRQPARPRRALRRALGISTAASTAFADRLADRARKGATIDGHRKAEGAEIACHDIPHKSVNRLTLLDTSALQDSQSLRHNGTRDRTVGRKK